LIKKALRKRNRKGNCTITATFSEKLPESVRGSARSGKMIRSSWGGGWKKGKLTGGKGGSTTRCQSARENLSILSKRGVKVEEDWGKRKPRSGRDQGEHGKEVGKRGWPYLNSGSIKREGSCKKGDPY